MEGIKMGDIADYYYDMALDYEAELEAEQAHENEIINTIDEQNSLGQLNWKTANGEIIRICDLRKNHLENCISFLKRKSKDRITDKWIEILSEELSTRNYGAQIKCVQVGCYFAGKTDSVVVLDVILKGRDENDIIRARPEEVFSAIKRAYTRKYGKTKTVPPFFIVSMKIETSHGNAVYNDAVDYTISNHLKSLK